MAENQPLLQEKVPAYNPDPGTAPPPQGYAAPPPNYQQSAPPPQGYAPPPQGYAPPAQGYAPPPQGYVPPAQGYAPPTQPQYQGAYQNQTATNVTVVQTNPTPTRLSSGGFGESSCTVNCPTCHNEVNTRVGYEAGALTWVLVVGLLLLGFVFPILWFGICLIPLFVDSCKDVVHTCPVCHTRLGSKSRM